MQYALYFMHLHIKDLLNNGPDLLSIIKTSPPRPYLGHLLYFGIFLSSARIPVSVSMRVWDLISLILIGGLWPGPFCPVENPSHCPKYWWRNFLNINNLWPESEMCAAWTWYLANDFQFFLFSPIFLVVFTYSPPMSWVTQTSRITISNGSASEASQSYQN